MRGGGDAKKWANPQTLKEMMMMIFIITDLCVLLSDCVSQADYFITGRQKPLAGLANLICSLIFTAWFEYYQDKCTLVEKPTTER